LAVISSVSGGTRTRARSPFRRSVPFHRTTSAKRRRGWIGSAWSKFSTTWRGKYGYSNDNLWQGLICRHEL